MINKRFAPKSKKLIYFKQESKSVQKQKSPKLFNSDSFSNQNFIPIDYQQVRHYQQDSKRNNILNERKFVRPLQSSNMSNVNFSQRSPILSARKQKLQNLRSSIQSLQKIIQRSREMLNESSILNSSKNTISSSKQKIKSDSLDIKFNYSTKKMNSAKLSQIKVNKLLNQSLQTQFILDDTTNQSYRQNLLLQSARKNQTIPQQKSQSFKVPAKQSENTNQIKTNHQLNMTLQKLLNQSFQSTINGKTLSISLDSPNSTFAGQTPKWFKSKDLKKSQKFAQKNKIFHLQNDSFSNHMNSIDTSELSQYEKIINNENQSANRNFKKRESKIARNLSPYYHNTNSNEQTFDQQKWNEIDTKQNIFIEDKGNVSEEQIENDIIVDDQSSGMKNIQNFFTNNRQPYHGQMKLQSSYVRNITNRQQQQKQGALFKLKPKRLVLRTPKAYQNYQQNTTSRKSSNSKSWIPKNFNQFENKVLEGKIGQNIFKQESNQGKFSPRIVHAGKQNKKEDLISEKKQSNINPEAKDKRKKFIIDVWKYPFVQRYLNESDIFLIYQKLRRSKVPEQKWILFVIDQVHKKMKNSHE